MQGVTVRAGWGRQLWIWEGGILGQGTEVRKMVVDADEVEEGD